MSDMFASSDFNGDISTWDVSRVTDMSYMFASTRFNGDISKWDVSRVTDMSNMFRRAISFNDGISKWYRFWGESLFDVGISKWNVSNVTNMDNMFYRAASFNGDISKWDVSSVTNMNRMFDGATSFKQRLCGAAWVYSRATKKGMFTDSPGSISRRMCQRWLARWGIASTPITTPVTELRVASASMVCPTCGTFKKSGRVSCCAPGGAWYKNCGGAGNRNVDHSWLQGVDACKRKCKVDGCRCIILYSDFCAVSLFVRLTMLHACQHQQSLQR